MYGVSSGAGSKKQYYRESNAMSLMPLLAIKNLRVDFIAAHETTAAVKDICLTVNRGEIVALVGESGSGKSVTALSILQLLPTPPARYTSGKILFENNDHAVDLIKLSPKE